MKKEKESLHRDSYFDVIILAGGNSKRFGCDKCEFEIDGKTMLQRVAENFDNPIIVTRKLRNVHGRQVIDCGKGPINAVLKALTQVTKEKVFLTGCDFPYITRKIVEFICSKDYDIVMPILESPQPLLGCYKVEILKKYLPNSKSFLDLIGKSDTYLIGTNELSIIDPTLKSLININSLKDLHNNRVRFTRSSIILKRSS